MDKSIKMPKTEEDEVLIVQVGNENRPATVEDIHDVQTILAQASINPGLTLVTHHAIKFVVVKKKLLKNVVVTGTVLGENSEKYSGPNDPHANGDRL